ncbi:surface-associated interspersed protein (SURFIN), fragment [Plasmodium gallinaceum]|uniref:Surface-associated interspersed protein (SURFIN) n=1 Tax=Plasmodium gallinaceum TaxID=5849 RepID=A0A1J1GSQ4_PLAGA|nr:LOW QUALITY PROTEIN: surface-associated interspersed protein (SURFIN), fragment [Plasmodium gallinaceum]CRG95505.1 surface-associated interspersed protein (SURFIN), fragment [Plasmodium gallinaceum]
MLYKFCFLFVIFIHLIINNCCKTFFIIFFYPPLMNIFTVFFPYNFLPFMGFLILSSFFFAIISSYISFRYSFSLFFISNINSINHFFFFHSSIFSLSLFNITFLLFLFISNMLTSSSKFSCILNSSTIFLKKYSFSFCNSSFIHSSNSVICISTKMFCINFSLFFLFF